MKQLTLFLAVLLIGLFASTPRPAAALEHWPPLLNCSDVNADGIVSVGDIGMVVSKFGTAYPMESYLLLYDVNGGGNITVGDIGTVVSDFGGPCPLIETQVTQATLALIGAYGGPDELIGGWYLVPTEEVCAVYGIPGPCQSNAEQPLGFGLTNTDEDNQDPPAAQQGWHTHPWLCVWNWGTTSALVLENVAQQDCETSGGIWFSTYGWMLHLYNVIPNPAGRFMLWNSNVP